MFLVDIKKNYFNSFHFRNYHGVVWVLYKTFVLQKIFKFNFCQNVVECAKGHSRILLVLKLPLQLIYFGNYVWISSHLSRHTSLRPSIDYWASNLTATRLPRSLKILENPWIGVKKFQVLESPWIWVVVLSNPGICKKFLSLFPKIKIYYSLKYFW